MFVARTKFLTALVWLLTAIQLLLLPAAGVLHSGCEGHSHSGRTAGAAVGIPNAPQQSFLSSVKQAWHWLTHSGCCHHSHSERSVAVSSVESKAEEAHRCSGTHHCSGNCAYCLRKTAAKEKLQQKEEQQTERRSRSPEDSPLPSNDSHQCGICHVVFAARLNILHVPLPTQTDMVSLAVPEAVPVVEITPRFMLSPRGPPVV